MTLYVLKYLWVLVEILEKQEIMPLRQKNMLSLVKRKLPQNMISSNLSK